MINACSRDAAAQILSSSKIEPYQSSSRFLLDKLLSFEESSRSSKIRYLKVGSNNRLGIKGCADLESVIFSENSFFKFWQKR